jgi:predicted transcriptional regulator
MNSNSKFDDVLFMSSGQFEQLTDTESFVFSHIAFFACQLKPYKRLFKQTTQAICNKVGYSPNAVRSAISSLISKGFLKKGERVEREHGSYHPYYDNIAHHLKIGDNDYALLFASELEKTLAAARSKKVKDQERVITFFKVQVGQLKRNSAVLSGNRSKHTHKALILHGYLLNQHKWNIEKSRQKVCRTVPFLSHFLNWSQNTVRRVLNTLQNLEIIAFEFANGVLKFLSINTFKVIAKPFHGLVTKLSVLVNKAPSLNSVPVKHNEPRIQKSPREAAQHLQRLKSLGKA